MFVTFVACLAFFFFFGLLPGYCSVPSFTKTQLSLSLSLCGIYGISTQCQTKWISGHDPNTELRGRRWLEPGDLKKDFSAGMTALALNWAVNVAGRCNFLHKIVATWPKNQRATMTRMPKNTSLKCVFKKPDSWWNRWWTGSGLIFNQHCLVFFSFCLYNTWTNMVINSGFSETVC